MHTKKHRKPQWILPGFGLPKVQVVDAVEVHVLRVPGEAGFPHSKVQIGCVYTLNGHSTILLNHIQDRVQVPDVPLFNVLR